MKQNEYCSGFVYNEYGFKSMKDMAYQLPSVFYVKENNESNQCVLYNAYRRNELENSLNGLCLIYLYIGCSVCMETLIFRSDIVSDKTRFLETRNNIFRWPLSKNNFLIAGNLI